MVSVVVPTRNGSARLEPLLDSLRAQTLPADRFEVVIVSDGSTDDTDRIVRASGVARVLVSRENVGVPRASNLGVRETHAPLLAFTDDDVVLERDWLEKGVERMARAERSEIVAGHIEVPLGERPTRVELLDVGRGYLDQDFYVTMGFGATANLWVHRSWFDELGGFDERFTAQTHDNDFGRRSCAAGGTVIYASTVRVTHPPRRTVKQLIRKEYRLAYGDTELRRLGTPGAPVVQIHRLAHYYRPWTAVRGLDRIRARGRQVGRAEQLRLIALQYVGLQLPAVAGSLAGARAARAAARDA